MKIIYKQPPNYEEIAAVFDIKEKPIIFTYGNAIYNPKNVNISQDLIIHEETHQRQQGNDPISWWNKYLTDKNFRLSQEIEAYQNQYRFVKVRLKDRNKLHQFGMILAKDLSSEIYGNIISQMKAYRFITT